MNSPQFEELDYRQTPLGELVLQRRRVLALDGAEAIEVKLNGDGSVTCQISPSGLNN